MMKPQQDQKTTGPTELGPVEQAVKKLKEQKEAKTEKRGPGRPRKEEPVPEIPKIQSGVIFNAVFNIIAVRLGDHWLLTKDEVSLLDESGNMIIQKYGPKMMKYIPEIYFGSVLVFIMSTKIMQHKEILKKAATIKVEPEPVPVKKSDEPSAKTKKQ